MWLIITMGDGPAAVVATSAFLYSLPFLATVGMMMVRGGVIGGGAPAGVARQWMAGGIYVNTDATSRQWMTPAGTYLN